MAETVDMSDAAICKRRRDGEEMTADDIYAECSRAAGLATSLMIVVETMIGEDSVTDKAEKISAAKFLAYELDRIAGNLEDDIREFAGGANG